MFVFVRHGDDVDEWHRACGMSAPARCLLRMHLSAASSAHLVSIVLSSLSSYYCASACECETISRAMTSKNLPLERLCGSYPLRGFLGVDCD